VICLSGRNGYDGAGMSQQKQSKFEQAAAEQRQAGFLGELWGFMKENKKWWLLPLILALLIFAALIFLSGTGIAPFIYTLF
jgi:hypothetical protein